MSVLLRFSTGVWVQFPPGPFKKPPEPDDSMVLAVFAAINPEAGKGTRSFWREEYNPCIYIFVLEW